MILRKNLLPIMLLLLVLASQAGAEVLIYKHTLSINNSTNKFDIDHFDLDLRFGNHQFIPSNEAKLFEALIISPADVGSTYEVTAGTDFDTASSRVTDGANEFISVTMTEDETGGVSEGRISPENMFFQKLPPANPPDLFGNVVNKIALAIDSFTLAGPGAIVEGQPVDLVVTISFFGIPEPQTLALGALGICSLLGGFKRRRERG